MIGSKKFGLTYKLIAVIVCGLVVGSVSGFIMNSGGSGLLDIIFMKYAELKQNGSFFELTYYSFFPVAVIIVINYFNGYSLLTGFIKYIIAFCVGTAQGLLSVIIYSKAINGIAYSVLVYIPFNILFALIIFLSLRETDKLSIMCRNAVFHNEINDSKERLLKEYVIKLILLLSLSFIVSLINAVANCIFFKFFTLFD